MGTGLGRTSLLTRGFCRSVNPGHTPVWGSYQAIKNLVCSRMVCPSIYYRRAVGQGQEVGVCCSSVGFTPCGLELRDSDSLYLVPCPTVRQYADICLFSTAQYKCPVAQLEQE